MTTKPIALTVFSFGAGQESTYLLHRLTTNKQFYEKHIQGELLIVGSDTGDEHPHTHENIERVKEWCRRNWYMEFHWITPDMGFHPRTWQSLIAQYRLIGCD